MNKNTIYVVLAILVVLAGGYYYMQGGFGSMNDMDMDMDNMSTSTDEMATNTASTTGTVNTGTGAGGTGANNSGSANTSPSGYPSSWPSDIPKYANGTVKQTGGNNPNSGPTEATVIFTTRDSVATVVNFYVSQLAANGWKITENGAGTANMTTIRATKGSRSVGGYILKETDGRTEVTLGVNRGL